MADSRRINNEIIGVTGLNKQVSDLSFLFNLLKQKMLGKLKKKRSKTFFFRGITLDTLSCTSTTIATPLTPHRGGWLCDKYMYIQNPCCVIESMIPLYYPYTTLIILHWEAMRAIKAQFTNKGQTMIIFSEFWRPWSPNYPQKHF